MAQDRFGNQVSLPRLETPHIPSGVIKYALWAILILLVIGTSFYQVEPDEVGVLLRFGREGVVPGFVALGLGGGYPVIRSRRVLIGQQAVGIGGVSDESTS